MMDDLTPPAVAGDQPGNAHPSEEEMLKADLVSAQAALAATEARLAAMPAEIEARVREEFAALKASAPDPHRVKSFMAHMEDNFEAFVAKIRGDL